MLKKDCTLWIIIGDSYVGGVGDMNKKGVQPIVSFASEFCNLYKLDGYKN